MKKELEKEKNKNLSKHTKLPSGKGFKIGVVVAEWNRNITHALLEACQKTLLDAGVLEEDLVVVEVPGAFELPQGAKLLMQSCKLDAVVSLGCVIKGETQHNEYINQSVALLLNQLAVASNTPQIFGVLTPNSMEEALDRAGGKYGNKGVEAAATALKMVKLKKELSTPKSGIGFTKM
jgi:6,7-dimethyl-8-ribityllumazine synthase